MSNPTCYYCSNVATSKEHVPPLCLFPEQKDANGRDFRKNLITVPSCDEHNTKKSSDDEFLMASLSPIVGNNSAAYLQTLTKLQRANKRSKGRLFNETLSDARNLVLKSSNGGHFPVSIGHPDIRRMCSALEHVARGLYFYLRKSRFEGKCVVLPEFVIFVGDLELVKIVAGKLSRQERLKWQQIGDNPEIFRGHLGPTDQFGLIPLTMVFFNTAEVHVAFQPEGVVLPHRTLADATPENPIKMDITLSNNTD